jgi:hypothetical protein
MPAIQLSDGNDDGQCLGQSSTDKISFYGATPVVRPAAITAVTAGSTTTVCNTSVAAIIAALQTLGLTA